MSVYVQYPPGSKKDIKISQHAGRHARRVLADCLYKSGHTIPQMMQPLMIIIYAVSMLLLHKVDVVHVYMTMALVIHPVSLQPQPVQDLVCSLLVLKPGESEQL